MKTNHKQRRVSTNTTQQWTTFLPPKAFEILTPFPDPISPQCSAHGDTRSLSPQRGVNGNQKSGPIHSLGAPLKTTHQQLHLIELHQTKLLQEYKERKGGIKPSQYPSNPLTYQTLLLSREFLLLLSAHNQKKDFNALCAFISFEIDEFK